MSAPWKQSPQSQQIPRDASMRTQLHTPACHWLTVLGFVFKGEKQCSGMTFRFTTLPRISVSMFSLCLDSVWSNGPVRICVMLPYDRSFLTPLHTSEDTHTPALNFHSSIHYLYPLILRRVTNTFKYRVHTSKKNTSAGRAITFLMLEISKQDCRRQPC